MLLLKSQIIMEKKSLIRNILFNTKEMIGNIINEINSTKDHEYRKELIFLLVDHFKDDRIIPTLIHLIQRTDLQHYNGSFIFACNEYSPNECKKYLDLFVDLVIDGDYEASMSASALIHDFSEPYDWDEKLLDKLAEKLRTALKTKNQNREFIEVVLNIFKE